MSLNGCKTQRLVLPLSNAHFIWYCAWLSLPSAIYAWFIPRTTTTPPLPLPIAIVPASVFTTSLLYWRKPLYDSWYRVLDITTVLSGVTYQSIYAFQTIRITSPNHHFAAYTAGIMLSAACYVLSNILMSRSRVWPATYAHASIHIVANIANLILYHGNI
jgi:hypothetical protein